MIVLNSVFLHQVSWEFKAVMSAWLYEKKKKKYNKNNESIFVGFIC